MGSRSSVLFHDYLLHPLFMEACEKGHSHMLGFFLGTGFSPDSEFPVLGGTFYQTALWISASNGDFDNVKVLVDFKANVNKCMSAPDDCFTPLFIATKNRHVDVVKFLLKNDAAMIAVHDDVRANALIFAVKAKSFELVRMFLTREINVDEKNSRGETALYWACRENADTAIVSFLLENGADANVYIIERESCLFMSCRSNNFAVVKLLLEHGANPNFVSPNSGLTPLHSACLQGSLEMVQLLLLHKAFPHPLTDTNLSPLFIAVESGHKNIVDLLCSREDVDVNVALEPSKHTPLYTASKLGHQNVIDVLIEAGACVDLAVSEPPSALFQTFLPGKNYPKECFLTPIYVAWLKDHKDIVSKLAKISNLESTRNLAKHNQDDRAEAYFKTLIQSK